MTPSTFSPFFLDFVLQFLYTKSSYTFSVVSMFFMTFSGCVCQVCKKNFSCEDSGVEVVVCPVCGAPYHRACYNSIDKCVFEDVHGTERDYCHLKECQNKSSVFHRSENCALSEEDSAGESAGESLFDFGDGNLDSEINQNDRRGLEKLKELEKHIVDARKECEQKRRMLGEDFVFSKSAEFGLNSEDFVDGISVLDFAKFILFNSGYYLKNFEKIRNRRRARFNFCAFWFPAAWFLYRKQYKVGSFLLFLHSFFSIFVSFLRVYVLPPIVKKIFGSETLRYFDFDFFNYFDLSENFNKLPFLQKFLIFLPSFSQFLTLAVMFLSGFFANKIYFRFCKNRIKAIKSRNLTGLEYDVTLMRKGGVNYRALILAIICYLIVSYLPGFFMR